VVLQNQEHLPPEFIEAAQKTYLTDLIKTSRYTFSITTAKLNNLVKQMHSLHKDKHKLHSLELEKQVWLNLHRKLQHKIQLSKAAYAQATDPSTGLGSFQPFLTESQLQQGQATALTGTGAGTGAGSIQSYMSPYQQQVIDTTMQDFDQQAQIRANEQAAATLGVPGAFGGGREGVQRAQYQAQSDQNQSTNISKFKTIRFSKCSKRRQQDLANQMGIANLQQGLGGAAQDFSRAQISGLGTLGSASTSTKPSYT
jgi:hypothetical protein